jgi:hypothetical protein
MFSNGSAVQAGHGNSPRAVFTRKLAKKITPIRKKMKDRLLEAFIPFHGFLLFVE